VQNIDKPFELIKPHHAVGRAVC